MKLNKLGLSVAILFISNLSQAAEHVILISVDGLRPDAINILGESALPGFYRFREKGAWTDNARSDFDYTRTLPNHSSMMTGRGVIGPDGHGQISNDMPSAEMTLHNNTGEEFYVSSVFDVAHDHGLSTALYVSKDKFLLFEQSYNAEAGAKDMVGQDNGSDKIDNYSFLVEARMAEVLINRFVADMSTDPIDFSFIHIVDPDSAGHGDNWTTPGYMAAVERVDSYLQKIFGLIAGDQTLSGNTAIILVADHGGTGRAHSDAADSRNHTVPFYVWGAGVAEGEDIYALNKESRINPGLGYPTYENAAQPIRNGDAANLAMQLLGLPGISGSTINAEQDLRVQ
jgi:predicted AlkP superfamily pyrophosphatase or phosphodiesterase